MTDPANPDLAALVGSRICHDLTSPLGAIGNGIELLALSGGAQGAEMQLITQSVLAAQARIRFFRMAFGAANAGQEVALAEIDPVLAAMSDTGRIRYLWRAGDRAPRDRVKLAFLAMMCAETALPRGGTIETVRTAAGWRTVGTGPQVRPDPGLTAWISQGPGQGALSPAQVQFALIGNTARDQGLSLSCTATGDAIAIDAG